MHLQLQRDKLPSSSKKISDVNYVSYYELGWIFSVSEKSGIRAYRLVSKG